MHQDFRDLLCAFNTHGVEYIVVGAHALAAHGHIRATKDMDIWVRPDTDNARRVILALRDFGSPLHDLQEKDLARPGMFFQIGVPPLRVDVMTAVDNVDFSEAWKDRVGARFADQSASVLSLQHLIRNKKAAGRLQDLADVEALERMAARQGQISKPPPPAIDE